MPLIPQPTYVRVYDADDYFSTRLNSDAWFEAPVNQKLAALIVATRAIDNLAFVGTKADPLQLTEFPRSGPLNTANGPPYPVPVPVPVPVAIYIACCEEAIVRLDGIDMEIEADGIGVDIAMYAGVKETYDRTTVYEATRAGIASQTAWNALVPWLADPNSIYLARA